MRRGVAAVVVAAALAGAAPAAASEQHPTLPELESEVMCIVCGTTIDQSNSAFADRARALIRRYIAEGDTKSQIEHKLVDQFGPQILAYPPKSGFNLLAWWLPIAGLVGGAIVLGFLAWRWSRRRGGPSERPSGPSNGRVEAPIESELERRLDEALARLDV